MYWKIININTCKSITGCGVGEEGQGGDLYNWLKITKKKKKNFC